MSIFKQSVFQKNNLFYWLALGLVLVPLLVVANGYYPNIYYKSLAIIWLCGTAIIVWLLKKLFTTNRFSFKNIFKPQFSWREFIKKQYLLLTVLVWLLWTTFTSALGFNWQRSWWGDWERAEGLMLLWLLFLAIVIFVKTINSSQWQKIIKTSLNISGLISVFAFIQLLGLDLYLLPNADRSGSTIGNAAFFATYALIHLGLALALAFKENNQIKNKYWYIILALINLGGVFVSGTRGAFLGLLAGVVVTGLLAFIWKDAFGKISGKLKIGLYSVLIIVALVVGLRLTGVINKLPYQIERIFQISLSSTTAQTRIEMWKYGWQGAMMSPVIGYGFENYQNIFENNVQIKYFQLTGSEIWTTRAHNVLVDRVIDGGFVALILYLAIFIGLVVVLIKSRHKNGVKFSVFLLATVSAYFVQNLFLFDSNTSYIFFFLIIGWMSSSGEIEQGLNYKNKTFKYLAYVILLTLILGLTWCVSRQWQAGVNLLSAVRAQESFDAKKANDLYLNIYNRTNRAGQAEKVLVNSLAKKVSASGLDQYNQEDLKEYLKNLNIGFEAYLQQDPRSVQVRFFYNRALILLSQLDESPEVLNKLDESLKINRELSPNNLEIIWAHVVAMIQKNDLEQAIKYSQEGINILPSVPTGYWFLSIIYFEQKNDALAYENAGKAIDYGYQVKTYENWNKLYDYYYNLNDYPKMEKLLYSYLGENKRDVDGYFALVELMKLQKKFDEARKTAKEILTFSPETTDLVFQEIERINYLEKYGKESTSTDETIFENVQLPLN